MADVRLSDGDDTYVQSEAIKGNWDNYFGLKGNDYIKAYQGAVLGGPGNDKIERIPVEGESWRSLAAAYWDSPKGVRVDLQAGTAEDGFGTTDTLIGVDGANGSNFGDWFNGNANDNYFWPSSGNDTVIGGLGIDGVGMPWFEPAPGVAWRQIRLDELDIQVAVDGSSAIVKPKLGKGFEYSLRGVEYLQMPNDQARYYLSDFITQQSMAEQAIAAGGSNRWNANAELGSATAVSYSFVNAAPASGVGAPGFRAFTATEQQLVRDILAKTSALAGINFTEVADNGANFGQIRLGVSQQTASKGVSWLPNQPAAGDLAGDVWMDLESMLGIAPGTEGYAALLHEIGHALGLRHPRNVDAGDNWAVQLRTVDDRTALSVMASVPSSDGLFRADWGPLDVLALRYLYGSRDVGMGDNSYILGHAQAASQTTIIDSGGTDSLDASAYSTGVNLNLIPGGLSSVGLTATGVAGVENLSIGAGTAIENAIGSRFDDVLMGNDLDNRFTGNLGNDWIEGGKGVDTAVFAGNRADYILSSNFGKNFVEARDGVSGFDTLISVERLQFSDFSVALDLSGNAGTTAKILGAVFGKEAVANKEYAGIGLQLMDGGMSYLNLMQLALNAKLGAGASNPTVVNLLYKNLVGSLPSADELKIYQDLLDSGAYTQASLGVLAGDHVLNTTTAEFVGLASNGLAYLPQG